MTDPAPALDLPPGERPAWDDPATQRTLKRYLLKAFGWLVLAGVFLLATLPFVTDAGDTKPGVPEIVPSGLVFAALASVLIGLLVGWRALQMTWVARQCPWRLVHATYEELPMRTPNGQPVLHLSDGENTWVLTLAALRWRWHRFGSQPQLLLAAKPGRGGVVATLDRRSVVWGGRSAFTRLLRRATTRQTSTSNWSTGPETGR